MMMAIGLPPGGRCASLSVGSARCFLQTYPHRKPAFRYSRIWFISRFFWRFDLRSVSVARKKKDMVYQKQIFLETKGHRQMHDLTADVAQIIHDSGVRTGTAHVFNVGSTGAIGAIEFEPGLVEDLPDLLDKLIPPGRNYGHEQAWHDGNGHSHLQATLLGPSLTVPVADRKPVLGTWQQIFHLECDIKPRRRTIVVTVSGE